MEKGLPIPPQHACVFCVTHGRHVSRCDTSSFIQCYPAAAAAACCHGGLKQEDKTLRSHALYIKTITSAIDDALYTPKTKRERERKDQGCKHQQAWLCCSVSVCACVNKHTPTSNADRQPTPHLALCAQAPGNKTAYSYVCNKRISPSKRPDTAHPISAVCAPTGAHTR